MPFIAIIIGIIVGSIFVVYYTLTTIRRKFVREGRVAPEDRLPPMIVGACLLAVGLFWFAWTSAPTMSPWPQILAGVPIGFGVQVVLLQSLVYLIDIYTTNANSAISGTIIVRSLIGGVFPLFAIPMYRRFGVCFPSLVLIVSRNPLTKTAEEGFLGFKLSRPLCSSIRLYSRSVLFLRSENSLVQQVCALDLISWCERPA